GEGERVQAKGAVEHGLGGHGWNLKALVAKHFREDLEDLLWDPVRHAGCPSRRHAVALPSRRTPNLPRRPHSAFRRGVTCTVVQTWRAGPGPDGKCALVDIRQYS